jgi:hypothetical protein
MLKIANGRVGLNALSEGREPGGLARGVASRNEIEGGTGELADVHPALILLCSIRLPVAL